MKKIVNHLQADKADKHELSQTELKLVHYNENFKKHVDEQR